NNEGPKTVTQTDSPTPSPASVITDSQDAVLSHNSAGGIRRYVFPPQTVLFRQGEMRHCAYLIDKGDVEIFTEGDNEDGDERQTLCILSAGEIFGEMALVDNGARTASAMTRNETEIFVIPRDSLHERIKGLDPIVSLLISLLIERYRTTRIHLPESIKQDHDGDLLRKISQYDHLLEDVLRLQDSSEQREIALREIKLEQELRIGLKEKQFEPVLQPILTLPDEEIIGFEALIRWQHPEKGLIFPDNFIPVAERTSVVQHLDRLMIEKACGLIPLIRDRLGHDNIFVSVNLSGINFGTGDLVNSIDKTLKDTGTDPRHIKLEITESALIGDADKAEKTLDDLRALGLSIALDDFGTGYSSLSY
ncbi:UNVERIFIED_CONTAM: hypothetical protein BEN50_23910, partial [Euhalothece sp. KZN 001]